ncbi:zinc finger-containing ubiquitin peptidase 1-like isoform X2 [Bacillus rossius redtenbacheri]|uniref:zinc finger-containing ubiquitin peptidase 1-like isoform X2 n=1 Tax=Bacillus rossius redtenbacheri TaxID=93214 RepID=UPI002FDD91DD
MTSLQGRQGDFRRQTLANMGQALREGELTVLDYYRRLLTLRAAENLGVDDGSTRTPAVMQLIATASQADPGVAYHFLSSSVDHFATDFGDRGWGCGYRNCQMLLSSMCWDERLARQLAGYWQVSYGHMPSVTHLQRLVETAWELGFDPEGRHALGGRVVNTCAWIGPDEIASMLGSIYVRTKKQDFMIAGTGPRRHYTMFDWVLDYFGRAEGLAHPLYLQHQGHSRTIVGVEVLYGERLNLLVLDPIHRPHQMSQLYDPDTAGEAMELLRLSLDDFRQPYYQVLAVSGVMGEREHQRSRGVLAPGGHYGLY